VFVRDDGEAQAQRGREAARGALVVHRDGHQVSVALLELRE
jgi:hypothetical protein